jgi:predicted O-linked N-acetylglucosamine transferase (SPINDLY family)
LVFRDSLGADNVDYIIADRIIIPADQRHLLAAGGHLRTHTRQRCSGALRRADPTRKETGLPHPAQCSARNNTYKITPAMFDVWMRLLSEAKRVQAARSNWQH